MIEDALARSLATLANIVSPKPPEAVESVWEALPGPQTQLSQSLADVVGYGGAAGGGKTDALLGLAFTQHRRSILFRSHFNDLDDMVVRGDEIMGDRARFIWGTSRSWRTPDMRRIRLAAADDMRDLRKYRGRPNDFLGIDEASEFPEMLVRLLMGWVRTTIPTQRTQTVLTFNPPMTAEGEWIIQYFAPWLDPDYPNPAEFGELRYFARIDDKDVEVPDDTPIEIGEGLEPVRPQSRTFIPARVTDNPFLMATDYPRQLNALPEPMRSQMLFGDFSIKPKDDEWQVIPSEWVRAAMKRSETTPRPDLALRALGVDASRGGNDQSVIASLYGNYVPPLEVFPGKDVPDGPTLARLVQDRLIGRATAYLDVIGVGTSPYDFLRQRKARVYGVNFSRASLTRDKKPKKDKTGIFAYANLRAECYWTVREMLDPTSDWEIVLPNDRELFVDLTAPRYNAEGKTIRIEPKEDIKKRIHRSPDKGDAVAMLLWGAASARELIMV